MGLYVNQILEKMSDTINKENIAIEIAEEFGISKSQSAEMINDIIEVMTNLTYETGKVRIPYFGTFSKKEKVARIGRNPKTKKEYEIPARELITFKASDFFKDFVNDN
jgi:nucleoid DNA-binding protein